MRKLLISIFLFTATFLNARPPEWINNRPQSPFYYWGIGVCDISYPNYMEVAKQAALDEIVQQISVKIESNSFVSIEEIDYDIHEEFKHNILTNSQAYLEDLQIFDSYKDKKNFYVCYRLDKEEYKIQCKAKSQAIAQSALEHLNFAKQAESSGNLQSAIKHYQLGLKIVEPWLFLDLSYMSTNVPIALYSGLMSIFDGLSISLQPQSINIKNLESVNIEIVAKLMKRDIPIPNIPLKSEFTSGAGKITSCVNTNNDGEGRFYLTSVSSKDALQNILIYIDNGIWTDLPNIYQKKELRQKLPQASFVINVEQQDIVCYIKVVNNTISPLSRQITAVISNDYFDVTTNEDAATHVIELATDLRKIGTINGDLGNLDEWLSSFNITIKDKDASILTIYSEDGIRILVPEKSSQSVVVQQASKELIKRFKRGFPKKLESINLR